MNDFDSEDGFNESLHNQSEMNKKQGNDFDSYQKSCSSVNEVKKHDSEICN